MDSLETQLRSLQTELRAVRQLLAEVCSSVVFINRLNSQRVTGRTAESTTKKRANPGPEIV